MKKAFQLVFILSTLCLLLFGKKLLNEVKIKTGAVKLTDVGIEMGVSFSHHGAMEWINSYTKNQPQLRKRFKSISASVAVADVNNDGWQDLFFPSGSYTKSSHLYINYKGKRFIESAEKYGLDSLAAPIRAVFLDCDNDGDLEIFFSTNSCPQLYKKNKYSIYKKFPGIPSGSHCIFSTSINTLDYNEDGLIDIVLGNRANADSPNSLVSADNGGMTVLFKNTGQCKFKIDNEAFHHLPKTHVSAIGVGDLDGSGKDTLWLANVFNDDHIYSYRDKKFALTNPLNLQSYSKSSMSSEWVYLEDTKTPYIFVSHIYEPGYFTTGNQFWHLEESRLVDKSIDFKINRCGWAWGAKFIDLDNDSFQDLIVVNGYISDAKKPSFFFDYNLIANMPRSVANSLDFWSSTKNYSFAGDQQDCIFLNKKNKRFEKIEISPKFDLETLDGRGLAIADFNNDGKMDLAVSNQLQRAQVYMNHSPNDHNWLGIQLVGTESNYQAIGSKVELTLRNNQVLKKQLQPLNGYSSQSDSRLHFGLRDQSIKSARVFWPSGKVQVFENLEINSYNLIHEHMDKK